jgi:serine/threonine-protein kinase
MRLQPGQRITESLQLRHLIGEGGMGQVWAADHLSLHRAVAVKCVTTPLADNADVLRRFELEAQTVARLASDHVPQIFDYAVLPDGRPFMVLELLEGIDLHSRLSIGDRLSLAETGRLVAQICEALSVAHASAIVHRDVKPDNIFLASGDHRGFTAKLLDFGIAKTRTEAHANGLTQVGALLGTPHYMSPEQLANAAGVDGRADLWSLAVVAYECLTGELPFPADSLGPLVLEIQRGDFRNPSELITEVPTALDAWFSRALYAQRAGRYASALEMAEAFSQAADTSRAEAPDSRRASTHPRPPRRLELVWPTMRGSPSRAQRGAHFRVIALFLVAAVLSFGFFLGCDVGRVLSWPIGGVRVVDFASGLVERFASGVPSSATVRSGTDTIVPTRGSVGDAGAAAIVVNAAAPSPRRVGAAPRLR